MKKILLSLMAGAMVACAIGATEMSETEQELCTIEDQESGFCRPLATTTRNKKMQLYGNVAENGNGCYTRPVGGGTQFNVCWVRINTSPWQTVQITCEDFGLYGVICDVVVN